MKQLKPIHIAWLFPFSFLIHILEEFYAGVGLPIWISNLFSIDLSTDDFILINATGFSLTLIIALLYSLGIAVPLVLLAFGTLVFVNGFIHLGASIMTLSYSPGTLSGIILFIPLGLLTFKKIRPQLSGRDQIIGISLGILIHVLVTSVAMNI